MQYLLITVVLVRHFMGRVKIGRKASQILNRTEKSNDQHLISVISLMEVMSLSEKNRMDISLRETLDHIGSSTKYTMAALNADVLRVAETINFYGFHDRLILATANRLQIPVIPARESSAK